MTSHRHQHGIGEAPTLHWIFFEHGTRWSDSLRRFYPDLFGSNVNFIIKNLRLIDTPSITPHQRAIVFWEVSRKNLVTSLDNILTLSRTPVSRLHFVACNQLNLSQRLALAEFDIAYFLEQPEDLFRCKPILDGYFARLGWDVD